MGLSREEARSSVRISFGRYNTSAEIDTLIEALSVSVEKLRRSGAKLEERLAV
jgi:cysteine sulfinate desulfinase/cysteine desulfurase-like protein